MHHADHRVAQRFLLNAMGVILLCGFTMGDALSAETDDLAALGLTPIPGQMAAPDFTLPTPQGQTHRLRDWKGKVVLLNFWATW